MKSSSQTRQRTLTTQDSRCRTTPVGAGEESSASARARQTLPAVDPSMVFGCVDWFLYPDQAVGRSANEAQRIPA